MNKQYDYIIVGLGIGGICLAHRLLQMGKRVCVIDSGKLNATSVAAGVVNPVVLKRLNPVWRAKEFLDTARVFYTGLEASLGISIKTELPLLRLFNSVEEQNNWVAASDQSGMQGLLDPKIVHNINDQVVSSFGFGRVVGAFRIDTTCLISAFLSRLNNMECLVREPFSHLELKDNTDHFVYGEYSAKRIVLCEGIQLNQNPLFDPACLIPKKGEYITFKATQLKLDAIIKGPYFIVPLGNDLYQAGATFAHGDQTPDPTANGSKQLAQAVSKMIRSPFEITAQTAGLRPTVKDRRPLLGSIGKDNRILIFNGFGTRGLLMAPLLSKWLIDLAEKGIDLPPEVAIRRYRH